MKPRTCLIEIPEVSRQYFSLPEKQPEGSKRRKKRKLLKKNFILLMCHAINALRA